MTLKKKKKKIGACFLNGRRFCTSDICKVEIVQQHRCLSCQAMKSAPTGHGDKCYDDRRTKEVQEMILLVVESAWRMFRFCLTIFLIWAVNGWKVNTRGIRSLDDLSAGWRAWSCVICSTRLWAARVKDWYLPTYLPTSISTFLPPYLPSYQATFPPYTPEDTHLVDQHVHTPPT